MRKPEDEWFKVENTHEAIKSVQDAKKWIELIRRYTNITELTADLLNALIEKIVVHEAIKNADGSRMQEVEVYYRFIGKIYN